MYIMFKEIDHLVGIPERPMDDVSLEIWEPHFSTFNRSEQRYGLFTIYDVIKTECGSLWAGLNIACSYRGWPLGSRDLRGSEGAQDLDQSKRATRWRGISLWFELEFQGPLFLNYVPVSDVQQLSRQMPPGCSCLLIIFWKFAVYGTLCNRKDIIN